MTIERRRRAHRDSSESADGHAVPGSGHEREAPVDPRRAASTTRSRNQRCATSLSYVICGNDERTKAEVRAILDQFGWDTADMGAAPAARAIEPLCMLWCIPGLSGGSWTHAFKLLRL